MCGVLDTACVSWWWWLVWIAACVALNAVLVPRVRRRVVARGLGEGRVPVSARALDAADVPARWHTARAVSRDGVLVLQRGSDHASQPGVRLTFVAPAERPVGSAERFRLLPDATHAVVVTTPSGRVELAGSRTAIAWLRDQLDPAARRA